MQPFELAALVVVLGTTVILLLGRPGAAISAAHKALVGAIVGLLAAIVVLTRQEDVLPDELEGPAQLLIIVVVSMLLLAVRRFGLAGPGGPRR